MVHTHIYIYIVHVGTYTYMYTYICVMHQTKARICLKHKYIIFFHHFKGISSPIFLLRMLIIKMTGKFKTNSSYLMAYKANSEALHPFSIRQLSQITLLGTIFIALFDGC